VGLFTAPLRDLVGVLDARIRQLEEEGETVPEPEAEAAPEEPVAEEAEPEADAEPESEEPEPAEAEAQEAPEDQTEEPSADADSAEQEEEQSG